MNRRNFVKLSAAGAAAAMMLGLPLGAQADENATPSYTAGTYTSVRDGKGGYMTVEVTFDETSITNVQVLDHNETRYISDRAIEVIPRNIVEHQSLNIDTVAGATITSFAILSAVEDCVEQAGGDVQKLLDAPGMEKSTETVELQCDLAVVGAGAAGMTAAVRAAQAGKNVVVLEKTSNMGGNALVCGGLMHYIEAPEDKRYPIDDNLMAYFDKMMKRGYEEGPALGITPEYVDSIVAASDQWYADGHTTCFDSPEFCALEYQFTNGGTFDKWVNFINTVPPLNDWLTEIGLDWIPSKSIMGFPWPRWTGVNGGHLGMGYFELYAQTIQNENLPITLLMCTPGTELIKDGDRVTGVKGVCTDGTTYLVHSSHGVILATGGYSGNPAMLKKYNTYWDWNDDTFLPTDNTAGHDGDGITMALAAGASAGYMQRPMLLPQGDPRTFQVDTIVGTAFCPHVDRSGKRFTNEKGTRFEISQAMYGIEDATAYIISDANTARIEDNKNFYGWDVDYLVEKGSLYRADTLEELAAAFGADPETLVAEVEEFNKYCREGGEDRFGRTVWEERTSIVTPPFYACPRISVAHITLGGILVDEADYCAISEDGTRIEGLYAAGETVAERSGLPSMSTGLYAVNKIFDLA